MLFSWRISYISTVSASADDSAAAFLFWEPPPDHARANDIRLLLTDSLACLNTSFAPTVTPRWSRAPPAPVRDPSFIATLRARRWPRRCEPTVMSTIRTMMLRIVQPRKPARTSGASMPGTKSATMSAMYTTEKRPCR